MSVIGVLIYACLSAAGLTMIKMGLGKGSTLVFSKAGFSLSFSWISVIGMCLYIMSFLMSLVVMKSMDLSVFYPLSAGLIYILVCILSVVMLKDRIGMTQLVGMVVILAGILIMNLPGAK